MIGGHPKILIIRLSAIGDVVRVLPAAHAIHRAFPGAQIDWVVEPAAADILQGNPALDRVIVFKRRPQFFRSALHFVQLCADIRDERYDIVLDFHGILKSGVLNWSSGASRRIAFDAPRAREQSHRFANECVELPDSIINRVDENLRLVTELDKHINVNICEYHIEKQFNATVCEYVRDRRSDRPCLAIVHPVVERLEKQWSAENFSTLIDHMFEDGRFDIVLTHGPGQRSLLDPILEGARHTPIVPPPCDSLREYAGLVSIASVFVGLDSGPMHIAGAVGTPVVAIFGGTDPRMHAPVGGPCRTLGGVPVQQRTDRASTTQSLEALQAVTPDAVLGACIDLLGTP